MTSVHRFTLGADTDVAPFLDGLGRRSTSAAEGTEVLTRHAYDTFDWRLFARDTTLEQQVGEDASIVLWRSITTGEVLGRFERDDVPRFVRDLDPGPATDRLTTLVEMRALVRLATVTVRRTTLRQLDDEGKTVARIVADEVLDPPDRSFAPVIEVVAVRGYDDEARRLAALLDAQVVLHPGAEDLLITAMRRQGFEPGSYSSKFRTVLDHGQGASAAFTEVSRALLDAIRANEPGLRDDLDSEFLHDFRVAVRRTRSILGEAHGVFPEAELDRFRAELKWLGQVTGPTRDLDVFLLDTADFAAELPPDRRRDLEEFTAFLRRRQRASHRALVADLDSARYATLIDDWSAFLDGAAPPTPDAFDAGRPAPEVAAERIVRAHRRLIRRGRRISPASEPERLHDLRKDAKRLRYLLECFGTLFEPDEVAPVVKELKGVQDVLGTFQDCEVQAGQLEHFAQEMLDDAHASAPAVMVIGLLVEELHHRGIAARDGFADRFATFDRPAVRDAVRSLTATNGHAPELPDATGTDASDPRPLEEPTP